MPIPVNERPCDAAPPDTRAARAEFLQGAGTKMVVAGFVITIFGVGSYCAVCFAGGIDTGVGDMLFRHGVFFTRATLAVLGLGTLVWLVGSFTYLRGAMDADEDVCEESRVRRG